MSYDGAISRDVTDRQVAMFSMFVGQGLFTTRAALASASRIPVSTLKSWAAGAAMPLHAVLHLRRFLPREAINMMTEPGGVRFAEIETVETNWDAIAADASGLVAEICDARKDGRIDHTEDARLKLKGRMLVAELSEVIETS